MVPGIQGLMTKQRSGLSWRGTVPPYENKHDVVLELEMWTKGSLKDHHLSLARTVYCAVLCGHPRKIFWRLFYV